MNPKRFIVLAAVGFAVLVTLAACSCPDPVSTAQGGMKNEQIEGPIRAVLDEQVQAWNRGDIEGFMKGYLKSNDTTFISGDTVTRGWQTVLDRYTKNYGSREKMGTLAFSELEIKPVGADDAVVIGRFQLTRASDTPSGRFTLIFRRTPDGWRIAHDHTSSAGS
jgi:beta-aspartyl-peptidase (threonine type)